MTQFQSMNLPIQIHQALTKMKFSEATPIQEKAIPMALQGLDIIGCAQTGTGKTAAFCIPIVVKILENPQSTALLLVPTRELAGQIYDVLLQLTSAARDIRTAVVTGGADMFKQLRALKQGPSIIVATPGRLADHIRRKSVNLTKVEILVLDEADRMLDMGFEYQINEILNFVPKKRQTLLFSATVPERVKRMAGRYQKNPHFISVGKVTKPSDQIKHSIVQTTRENKKNVLLDELNGRKGSVIIFVNTQQGTNRLAAHLDNYGHQVTLIHGGRSQGQRNRALSGFRAGKFRIMVATDLASRGLDVPQIAHVINFDLPKDIDDYIHRIGRTARAGAEGQAICLLSKEDKGHWNKIAKQYNLDQMADPGGSNGLPRNASRNARPFKDRSGGSGQPRKKTWHRQQRA